MQIIYDYNIENNVSTCIIKDKNREYVGKAYCHPEDLEFKSQITGTNIAEVRAQIKRLQSIKNNEIKPALKSLKHLLNNMKTSKHFNKNSYEAKAIWRHIHFLENQLTTINQELADEHEFLKTYISEKEKFKQRTLKNKEKSNDNK